jgi:hypothetical protein
MKFGESSSFIEDANNFISENNKPINLTIRSNGMSSYISGVVGFISEVDNTTGNQFWRFKNKGGNDSFYCMNSNVSKKSLYEVNLRNILNKAKSQNVFKPDRLNNAGKFDTFSSRIFASHYSAFFFNSYQRDGYILKVDEEKNYRLDENNGNMEVYMSEILKNTDFYYIFYPDPDTHIYSTGYKGIGVKVVQKSEIPKDMMTLI